MRTEKFFKQSIIEGLKFYVYALVDARDNQIFYVGKGLGNRVYQHAHAALINEFQNLKLSTIREIEALGLNVKYYIIRHNLTEKEAYLVESSIIDLLTYKEFNKENILTNIVSGHHQWNEGIKTDEEIKILYDCPKIEPIPGERLLLVSLNKSYKQTKATGVYRRVNDYEGARKYWYLSRDKADKVENIFSASPLRLCGRIPLRSLRLCARFFRTLHEALLSQEKINTLSKSITHGIFLAKCQNQIMMVHQA